MDIGFDNVSTVTIDFTNTGLDLQQVNIDAGNFQGVTTNGQQLTLTKPGWVSSNNKGYVGLSGNNVPGLGSFTPPACYNASSRRNLRAGSDGN